MEGAKKPLITLELYFTIYLLTAFLGEFAEGSIMLKEILILYSLSQLHQTSLNYIKNLTFYCKFSIYIILINVDFPVPTFQTTAFPLFTQKSSVFPISSY